MSTTRTYIYGTCMYVCTAGWDAGKDGWHGKWRGRPLFTHPMPLRVLPVYLYLYLSGLQSLTEEEEKELSFQTMIIKMAE